MSKINHVSPGRQSARMSKNTNDGLTRSATGCFSCMATVDANRLNEEECRPTISRWSWSVYVSDGLTLQPVVR